MDAPPLDIRTVNLAWSVMAVTMAILMVGMQRSRKTYPGFGYWTIATLVASLGLILVYFRDSLPLVLSMVGGNLLLLLQVVLIRRGLETFVGRRPPLGPDLSLVGLYLLAYCWLTYGEPSTRWRIIVFSLYYIYYYLLSLRVAIWRVPAFLKPRNWLLIVPISLLCLFYVVRVVVVAVWGWGVADILAFTPLNAVTIMVTFSLSILVLAGLIFLNVQRLEAELSSAKRELNLLGGLLPICSNCKSIRDDQGYWHAVERYIASHSQTEFTHGICPDCMRKLYPEVAEKVLARLGPQPLFSEAQISPDLADQPSDARKGA